MKIIALLKVELKLGFLRYEIASNLQFKIATLIHNFK